MHCVGFPILEQPITITLDRQSGRIVERRWLGINAAVLGQAQIESGFADSIRFESYGATALLVARYGTPQDGSSEILTTQLEMRGEEITQSIWKHVAYSGLSKFVMKAVQEAADSTNSETEDRGAISDAIEETGSSFEDFEVALAAYYLLLEGTDNYLVDQSYVFIRTRTGSRNYEAVFEYAGDGKIWSSGQVAAYVVDAAPFNVPQLSAVANAQTLRLAFGWRKRPTDVTKISNGNQQIVESWQSARWTMLLYTAMT